MDSKDSSSSGGDKSHRRHAPSIDARGKLLAASGSPCGACKFLRRKCLPGCVFAPHFASEQGPERFAAVHRVFGASNASKLLSSVPVGRRHDAAVTICFEAQARLADPVYGCVATILALQQQVTSLQTDLSIMHSQLLNCQLAIANSLHGLQQAQHMAVLQPAYSNNSSASTDMVDVRSFPVSLDLGDTMPPSRDFEPLPLSQPSQDDQEEETSQDHVAFVMHNEGFGPK